MTTESESRKEEILKAVLQCVAEFGADEMTIRRVADQAGVSTGLVLYYFPSKVELIQAAWRYALAGFSSRIQDASGKIQGLAWLEALFRVCFINRSPDAPSWTFWLEYWAKAARDEDLRLFHSRSFADISKGHAFHVAKAVEAQQIRAEVDPTLAGDMIQAILYGLAVEVTLDRESISPERAFAIATLALSLLQKDMALESD